MLVHLQTAEILKRYVVREVVFGEKLITRIDLKDLPRRWRSYPPPKAIQHIGDEWVATGRSAVLLVPSAVVESESNFILNVAHPDFKTIKFGRQLPYMFDPRLLKR